MHVNAIIDGLAIAERPDPRDMPQCADCGGPIYQTQLFGGTRMAWVHYFDDPAGLAEVERCPAVQEFRHTTPAKVSPEWFKRCPDCQGIGDHETPEGFAECGNCGGEGRVPCPEAEAECVAVPVAPREV